MAIAILMIVIGRQMPHNDIMLRIALINNSNSISHSYASYGRFSLKTIKLTKCAV